MLERLRLWPLRLLWLALPLTVGRAVVDALADRSSEVQAVAEIGLWLAWFVGLVASLAPSTVTLTILRIVAPGSVAVIVAALAAGGEATSWWIVGLGHAVVATFVVFMSATGDPMINGSAYGSERRMALRPPAAVLLGPVQAAWLAVAAGATVGPLLLAAKQWLLGVPLTVLGAAAVYFGARALHQLSRRWIVFVPAGFVIHDYLTLAESLLIQRRQKPRLGPAQADLGQHLDLSGGALGLALSVAIDEEVPVALRRNRTVESTTANQFVFTPSLPGQLLQEARARAITIA